MNSKQLLGLFVLGWALGHSTPARGWSFVVFGDSRGTSTEEQINTAILGEFAQAIVHEQPAFVLVHGDLVNFGAEAAFQEWTNVFAPVFAAGIPVYPVMGNHDLPDVAGFTNVFGAGLPDNGPADELDRTYALTYSNALILCLDAYMPSNALRVNQAWIDTVLATNTRPHVFAQSHLPAFGAAHSDCLGTYPTERNRFWQSLREAHCRLYFCGHDHFYDHAALEDGDGNPDNNVHQMIVATGGAPFYSEGAYLGDSSPYLPIRLFHEANYGFVKVEIDGLRARATWYRRTGINQYEPTTEGLNYSLAPRPVLSFRFIDNGLVLTWTPGATLQAASDPRGVFADVPDAVSPLTITNFAQSSLYFRIAAPDTPPLPDNDGQR